MAFDSACAGYDGRCGVWRGAGGDWCAGGGGLKRATTLRIGVVLEWGDRALYHLHILVKRSAPGACVVEGEEVEHVASGHVALDSAEE